MCDEDLVPKRRSDMEKKDNPHTHQRYPTPEESPKTSYDSTHASTTPNAYNPPSILSKAMQNFLNPLYAAH